MSTDAADDDDDVDDDDDDGAPTTLPPQPSPSAHPVQEKISRSGEPLTLIKYPLHTPEIVINVNMY